MRKRGLVLIALALLPAACSAGATGPAEPNLELSFRTTDGNAAVAGARLLMLRGGVEVESAAHLSDADGLLLASVEGGSARLRVSAHGFVSVPGATEPEIAVDIPAEGLLRRTVRLQPVSGAGSMGWAEVHALDAGGDPVSGALVVALGEEIAGQAAPFGFGWTDAEGMAFIPNLPAGSYTVRAARVGFRTQMVQSMSVGAGAGVAADLAMGTDGLGAVQGTVTGAGGDGSGARVWLVDPTARRPLPGATAVTTAGGHYRMEALPPGMWLLRASKDLPAKVGRPGLDTVDGVPSVRVEADRDAKVELRLLDRLDLNAPAGGTLTGLQPELSWTASSAGVDFWVVEVRDASDRVVYGGFARDGTPRLRIPSDLGSVTYGSTEHASVSLAFLPAEHLRAGRRYRWRVFGCADDAGAPKGIRILAASPDRDGFFEAGSPR